MSLDFDHDSVDSIVAISKHLFKEMKQSLNRET